MSTSDAPPPDKSDDKSDVLFVHSPSERGDGVRVIRSRDNAIEFGELRNVEEGKPLHGDLVRLKQRKEHERLFDVETIVAKPAALSAGTGPAQVATAQYRENWDTIFGARQEKAGEPN